MMRSIVAFLFLPHYSHCVASTDDGIRRLIFGHVQAARDTSQQLLAPKDESSRPL
jgi:hypothetical protein